MSEGGSLITNIPIIPKWNMSRNWGYFEEMVNSYAVLMGYTIVDAPERTKQISALKYSLLRETRTVLNNHHIMECI